MCNSVFFLSKLLGRHNVVRTAILYGISAPVRKPVGFSATFQTGQEAQMLNGELSWVYRARGVMLTTHLPTHPHPCIDPRLNKVYSYTSNSPLLPSWSVDREYCTAVNVDTMSHFKDDQSRFFFYLKARSTLKMNAENFCETIIYSFILHG